MVANCYSDLRHLCIRLQAANCNYKNYHEAFTVGKVDKRQFGNLEMLALLNFAGVIGRACQGACCVTSRVTASAALHSSFAGFLLAISGNEFEPSVL